MCKVIIFSFCRYYRGTHGVIIVYDVTNGESFANVKRWLQEIENNCEVVNKVLGKKKLNIRKEKNLSKAEVKWKAGLRSGVGVRNLQIKI